MIYRRGNVDEDDEDAGVIDVTGVRVCKMSAKFGVYALAILYSSVTSFKGQRLCPENR